jgi:hypothetical protein
MLCYCNKNEQNTQVITIKLGTITDFGPKPCLYIYSWKTFITPQVLRVLTNKSIEMKSPLPIPANLRLLVLFFVLLSAPFLLYSKTFQTINSGSWTNSANWNSAGVPDPDGSNIGANDVINVFHSLSLNASFFANRNNLTINIGNNPNSDPVELFITGPFEITSKVTINIFEYASLTIGDISQQLPLLCPGDTGYTTRTLLFDVDGTDSSMNIDPYGKFELFGDMEVKNKFTIKVQPDGEFIVHGGFKAAQGATIELFASSASVGCDMEFGNQATIVMSVATLNVGGDLLFGNTGFIDLSGSTIFVGGFICSGSGIGGGAVVYVTGDLNNPSVISGTTCATIELVIPPGVILPIDLLSFTSEVLSDRVVLNWTTGTEINNDFFTLERSRDLYGWDILGFVPGAGNSSVPLSYSFSDLRPLDGLAYYRLKQTDFDGKHKYYGPVAANYDPGLEGLDFKVMKQFSNWVIAVPNDGVYQVEVYNLQGHRLVSEKIENTITIPAPDGAVVIRVTDGFARSASRVVM